MAGTYQCSQQRGGASTLGAGAQQSKQQQQDVLNKVFLTPELPGSFSGLSTLLNETNKLLLKSGSQQKVSQKTVEHFLKGQDAYTLHKELHNKRHFVRNPIKLGAVYDYAQADLMSFVDLETFNKNVKYILTVIDTRSRFIWFKFQKTKGSQETLDQFKLILKEIKPNKFNVLSTDQGKEFSQFATYLKQNGIRYFTQFG